MRVYYTLADWRSKPFLSGSLREHSYLFGGLRSRNYHAVLENITLTRGFRFSCF